MEELSKLAGGVKGELIGALSKSYPLTAKKAYDSIKRTHVKVSYQAVHKALKELEKSGVSTRSEDGYSLNRNWLSSLSQEISGIVSSQEAKSFSPIPIGKSRIGSTFRAINLLKYLLTSGQVVLSRDEFFLQGHRVAIIGMSLYLDLFLRLKRVDRNQVYRSSMRFGERWFQELRERGLTNGELEKEMQFGVDALSIAGWGGMNIERVDPEEGEAYVTIDHSPFASEYLDFKGKSRIPVDDLFRGCMAGGWRVILNNPTLECVETQCIACGAEKCVFETKPRNHFDYKNRLVRVQLK